MANKLLISLLGFSCAAFAQQDPTAPLGWQKAPESKPVKKVVRHKVPTLQSIVCGEQSECYAILNGKALSAGEKINGYQLNSIQSGYVTVARGGKQWKLEMFPLEVKQ